ncbi:metallophosphoesterase family protein [Magnetococcus sp. PR-3]|uniref:metallophosphoesterase family protein n=1 Tax=Magnetococcus sp. PR-3 TaxID=3120355 RepID=UPI002FCE4C36
MNFSFIHCADIHLDSPMQGLDGTLREKLPPGLLENLTRNAWVRLIDEAIAKQVAFVTVAGDLYDGDWKDYRTGLFFAAQAQRLQQVGIPLIILLGNHDAQSKLTKSLTLPDNVQILDHKKPQTILLAPYQTAIHGWSYPRAAMHENMVVEYPEAHPDFFNIGLLHTAMDGREGHDPYAPCRKQDLLALHYHYWGLGHAHTCEALHTDPPIWYSGNLQGRHIRETGAKGYLQVDVTDQQVTQVTHCPVDDLRWAHVNLSLEETEPHVWLQAIRTHLQSNHQDSPLLVRLTLHGRSPLFKDLDHLYAECDVAAQEISHQLWIEKIRIKAPKQTANLSSGNRHDLLSLVAELAQDPEQQHFIQAAMLEQMRGPAKKRLEAIIQEGALNTALEEGLALLDARLSEGEA